MEVSIIDLEWEGPFKVVYDRDNGKYLLDEIPSDLLASTGFYQVYGRHPVYGKDVLLYIGETKGNENGTRAFRDRLGDHLKSRSFYHTNLSISLAPYVSDGSTIKEVESVLIYSHMPALNSHHLDSNKKCKNNI